MSARPAASHIADYHFLRGAWRGTQFSLLDARLLHLGVDLTESISLRAISSVRVAFERNTQRIGWGAAIVFAALFVLLLAGPFRSFIAHSLADVGAQIAKDGAQASAVAQFLEAALHALRIVAAAMPFAALALAAWGVFLVATGWVGQTSLVLVLPATEREFRVPGRDQVLIDFADLVAESAASPLRR